MSLKVYTGGMYSSKSSTLLAEITKYTDISEKRCSLIINHSLDTRDHTRIVSSHNSMYKGVSERVDITSTLLLRDIDVSNYTIVGIDEAQMFDDLPETVEYWLSLGKHIIVAGLDSDFKMRPFGKIRDILHLSDTFVKLNAVCSVCIKENGDITPLNIIPAPFTKRITDSEDLIDIGGRGKYIPVCRKHHLIQK